MLRVMFSIFLAVFLIGLPLSGRSETNTKEAHNETEAVSIKHLRSYPMPGSGGTIQIKGDQVIAYFRGYDIETKGCLVVDVKKPKEPKLIKTIDLTHSTTTSLISRSRFSGSPADVFLAGRLAYVSDHRMFLQIFDVSQPTSPTLVSKFNMEAGPAKIFVQDNIAYLATTHLRQPNSYAQIGYLWIIDVSRPEALRLLGKFCTQGGASGVFVRGRYAYVTAFGDENLHGLQIIDVSDPASPKRVGYCRTPGTAKGLLLDGNIAFINDMDHGVELIDIRDPAKPHLVANFFSLRFKKQDCYLTPAGLAVSNGFLFVTWSDGNDLNPGGGLQIVDVRRFLKPTRAGKVPF